MKGNISQALPFPTKSSCAIACALLFSTPLMAASDVAIEGLLVDNTALAIEIVGAAGPEHGGGAAEVHEFTTTDQWELEMGTFQDAAGEIVTLTDAEGDTFRLYTTGLNNNLPPSGTADGDFDGDGQLLLNLTALRGDITFVAAAGMGEGPEHNGGVPETFTVNLWAPDNNQTLITNSYDADTDLFALNWDVGVVDGCPPATGGMGEGPEHGGGECTINLDWKGTVNAGGVGAVPLPAAAWLLGSGLIGLVAVGRRKKTA